MSPPSAGRYYAMDRDKRWDRVAKAYLAIAEAQGPHFADAPSVVDDGYGRDVTDEFIVPAMVGDYRGMQDGDGMLCFNFRADRVREILGALLAPDFSGFPRPRALHFAAALGMTFYSDALAPHLGALFAPQTMDNLLGQVVAARRAAAIAHGRDREIRPRHLLPQRRRGAAQSGRGPHPRPVAESRDL